MIQFILLPILALCIFEGEQWQTGIIPVNSHGDIAYILFKARSHNPNAPLLLWLTGGPGCSSFIAAFQENGPYTLIKNLTLVRNPFSWNNEYDVLYLDQPSGVGFSDNTGETMCNNSYCAARDMTIFLAKFVITHNEYMGRKFYITGESYAGHYIPVLAEYLQSASFAYLDFKAILIGNGWYDPYHQIKSYPIYTYSNKLISFFEYLYSFACEISVQISLLYNDTLAYNINEYCGNKMVGVPARFNKYDIRQHGGGDSSRWIDAFFDIEENRKAIGMTRKYHGFCGGAVMSHFMGEYMEPINDDFLSVLNSGLPILLYSGKMDFICNWMSTEMFLHSLGTRYNDVNDFIEYHNAEGETLGRYKKFKNLIFMVVDNAGHMVPTNQPANALYLITQFIEGKL